MKNKKSQFFFGGLVDASTLPRWILYPLMILIILILLFTLIFMGAVTYSCLTDKCIMPLGYFGFYGFPVMSASWSSQNCYVNNQRVNCSEVDYGR